MSNKPNLKKRPPVKQASAPKNASPFASPIVWIVGLVIVAAAVAIGISAGSSDDVATIGTETAFAEALGDALPPFAEPDTAIGMIAPKVSAENLDGERVILRAEGTPRLFGFFAHWCPHCQEELPQVAEWLESNSVPEGVEVVAVSTAVDRTADNFPPSEWFEREGWSELVVLDSETDTIANGFGLTSYPYWVAVDGDGAVVQRVAGAMDDAQLEAMLETLGSLT